MILIRRITSTGILAATLTAFPSAQSRAPNIERLAWLSGCWMQTRPDGLAEEHWMKPSGGSMLGMSRTVRGGRMTEFEFLQIREVGGTLAYIAKPSGQPEATFPLKTLADQELVFENLEHDFPQRIIYRRNAEGIVTARVEGTMKGQLRGIDFPFARCP
jgi:hypothetical protein